jgi:hypothetical protein
MNVRTICYFGLARNPQRLQGILEFLPDNLKADCERVIEELKQKEPAVWKAEWVTARRVERKLLTADLERALGGKLSNLPAALRQHLLWRAATRR